MYIGIDIGGGHSTIGLVDKKGGFISQRRIETVSYLLIEAFVEAISVEIYSLTQEFNVEIEGVGIGAPNGNFLSGSIEYAPNLPWRGIVPLSMLLSDALNGIPVQLTNDANAAALGELKFGVAKSQNIDDFIMITLGTGLGSGVVVNGQLVYGHDGFAGELGHVLVEPNKGRVCGCGRKGCLERYASATGLVLTAIEALQETDINSILKTNNIASLSAIDIYKAAEQGDRLALEVFDKTARILAFALANATTITSPQAFILFGGLAQSGDLLISPLKKYFEEFVAMVYRNKVSFLLSDLPLNQSAILGAAALAMEQVQPSQNNLVNK